MTGIVGMSSDTFLIFVQNEVSFCRCLHYGHLRASGSSY